MTLYENNQLYKFYAKTKKIKIKANIGKEIIKNYDKMYYLQQKHSGCFYNKI